MRRRASSWVVVGGALAFALFPFFSSARLSGEALAQLPDVDSATFVDDQHRLAIFSDDFVVATRVYDGTSIEAIRTALTSNGYEISGLNRASVECCGDSDGIWVVLTEVDDGSISASLSPVDKDIQATWPVFPIMAVLLGSTALVLLRARSTRLDIERDIAASRSTSPQSTESSLV